MPADGGGRGRAVGEAGVYAVTRIVAVPSATAVNVTRAPQFNSLRDNPLCGAKTRSMPTMRCWI